ncbi:alkaline phosphatase [Thorsellia anophelis]|uniref:Alkaline phosphatase n=1 Tax=Thorsellia anophelis DSM 18579 TaxID=1123402 RepID=A0A1I0D513_9GAMM|nr:alkaline phosphatase [Thorsellia anophelis]SET27306.1 alkaline phosphatase [Thorsellia anophelis DSM 18579]
MNRFKLTAIISYFLSVPLMFFHAPITADTEKISNVKNVIFLIPDGMSGTSATLARLYKGEHLVMDGLASGLMSTWSADGTVADSAPAGTAMATSWKAQSGNVGITGEVYDFPNAKTPPETERLRPVASLLEAAKLSGKSVGIVSTSEFMHATPAAFTAHDISRKNYDNLTEQILHNGLTVILGGGLKYLQVDERKDNEDMQLIAQQEGFSRVNNTSELMAFDGQKLLGVFAKNPSATSISYDIDRDKDLEPSLSQMTKKAIEILNKNDDGFFLMVEGSKVDWAAHANDPIAIVSEVLSFDSAVHEAYEFAKKDQNTLVIIVPDHGNSGISIGDRSTSTSYNKTHWSNFVDPLKNAKMTGEAFEDILPNNFRDQSIEAFTPIISQLVEQNFGITDLTNEEIKSIHEAKVGYMGYAIGPIMANRAKIGFTTNGHTGQDVILYSYDPRGKLIGGLLENTELSEFIAKSIGVDLDRTTNELFINVENEFKNDSKVIIKQNDDDPENPVLILTKNDDVLIIPRNKNYVTFNDDKIFSKGVNIFNGTNWFVSESIISLMK